MSRKLLNQFITTFGILLILSGLVAMFLIEPAHGAPVSRYTPTITHDSAYFKQGERATRSYTDTYSKADSIFSRTAKINATIRADSINGRAIRAIDLIESKYLKVNPDASQELSVLGDNLIHFYSVAGAFQAGSFFDKTRLWLESNNPLTKYKIEVDSSDNATNIFSTGNYLSTYIDTSFGYTIQPRAFGIAGGMFVGTQTPGHTTARLQIQGATGALGTVPLQLMPGPVTGFPVTGGIEYTGRHFYGSDTLSGGIVRRAFVQQIDTVLFPVGRIDSLYSPKITVTALICSTGNIDSLNNRVLLTDTIHSRVLKTSGNITTTGGGVFSDNYVISSTGFVGPSDPNNVFLADGNGLWCRVPGLDMNFDNAGFGRRFQITDPSSGSYVSLSPGPGKYARTGFNSPYEYIYDIYNVTAKYGIFMTGYTRSKYIALGFGTHLFTNDTLRGAIHFLQRTAINDTSDYVPIVMEPRLATLPQDGGIEYDNFSFWGTDTLGGTIHRKPFVRQGDTLKTTRLIADTITLAGGYNPAPSYSGLWRDTVNLGRLLPTALTNYGMRLQHAGLSTSGIVQDTTDTTGSKLIILAAGVGTYHIGYNVSYKTSATDTMNFSVFKNSTKSRNIQSQSFASTASTLMVQSAAGVLSLALNDTLRLKVNCSANSHTITLNCANLNIMRIGN
jgi:hypothetical protein